MAFWIALIVLFIFVLVGAGIVWWRRRRPPPPAAPPPPSPVDDLAERRARQRLVDEVGSTLLERRVELDGRRGTLGGDTAVFDALDQLEQRYRGGEIGEEEYEQEKVRLLSGG